MNILDEIFAYKREEVAARMRACPLAQVQRDAEAASPRPGFCRRAAYMRRTPGPDRRVKRASPSRGLLVQDFDPLRLARVYQENGAAAISVLTDERYFQGHLDYLRQIARTSAARCRCCARILSAIPTRSTKRAPPGRMRCC